MPALSGRRTRLGCGKKESRSEVPLKCVKFCLAHKPIDARDWKFDNGIEKLGPAGNSCGSPSVLAAKARWPLPHYPSAGGLLSPATKSTMGSPAIGQECRRCLANLFTLPVSTLALLNVWPPPPRCPVALCEQKQKERKKLRARKIICTHTHTHLSFRNLRPALTLGDNIIEINRKTVRSRLQLRLPADYNEALSILHRSRYHRPHL